MSIRTTPQIKNFFSAQMLTLLIAVIHFIFSAALILVSIQFQDINILFMAGITLAIALMGIIVNSLIRRGEKYSVIWFLVITICAAFPLTTLISKGLAWFGLILIPIFISFLTIPIFPRKQAGFAIGISILSGVSCWLIDTNITSFRISLPTYALILPVLLLLLLALLIQIISVRFSSFSLQGKLILLFSGVSLVPLIIINILNTQANRDALTEAANLALSSVANQTRQEIDSFVEKTTQSLENQAQLSIFIEALTENPEISEPLETDLIQTLQVLVNENPEYLIRYDLLNREGIHIIGVPQLNDKPKPFLGLNDNLVNGLKSTFSISLPYISPVILKPESKTPLIYFSSVVNAGDGRPLGMLVATYDAAIFQNIINNQNNSAGEGSFGILYDEHYIQLAHGRSPETNFKTLVPLNETILEIMISSNRLEDLAPHLLTQNWPELERKLQNSREEPNFLLNASGPYDENNQVVVYRLSSRPWSVAFFQAQDIFLEPVNRQTRFNIIIGVIFTGIISVVAIVSSRIIGQPITNLAQIVENISEGDLSVRAPVTTQDEIGKLASTFNDMTSEIQSLLTGLEDQVTERTKALERRAIQLQTAAEVAREASKVQDLDKLLSDSVNLISRAFGFYHTGIFLIDEKREFAVLMAANSEGGKKMLSRGHKLRVGHVGIVGDTTQSGHPHIAQDVEMDRTHFAHSFLPETRSEMALPLMIGEEIIGALDVQSKAEAAFDNEDISVLQVLADQLAVAIRNSQLLNEVQQTVVQLQAAYGDFTKRSWQDWSEGKVSGYRYRNTRIQPILGSISEKSLISEINLKDGDPSSPGSTITIPLKLRDTQLGQIILTVDDPGHSEEIKSLVTDISDRLALALENARLIESAQQRASQEQLISHITSKMRETLDLETILKTTAEEIQTSLKLPEVIIRLGEPLSKTGSGR